MAEQTSPTVAMAAMNLLPSLITGSVAAGSPEGEVAALPNYMQLSKTKVVYARVGEELDTLIVFEQTRHSDRTMYKTFGVKGAIISTNSPHRFTIRKREKFKNGAMDWFLDSIIEGDARAMDAMIALSTDESTEMRFDQVQLSAVVDARTRIGMYSFDSICGT